MKRVGRGLKRVTSGAMVIAASGASEAAATMRAHSNDMRELPLWITLELGRAGDDRV